MGPFAVPELAFVQITDPESERFAIDRDEDGQDTLFGTVTRTSTRSGARSRRGSPRARCGGGCGCSAACWTRWTSFCRLIGKEIFLIEPLFYHSAILYERHGCGYLLGREVMETIDGEFRPGGRLHRALDGATPFRQPDWPGRCAGGAGPSTTASCGALDGRAWGGVKMYGGWTHPASVVTFPTAVY